MHQRLLVARQNDFDFILFVKLIADVNGAGSRITEEILNTLLPSEPLPEVCFL